MYEGQRTIPAVDAHRCDWSWRRRRVRYRNLIGPKNQEVGE